MHYFLTGHTGFKGSWLILLLSELGHEVSGFSVSIPEGGLFQKANLRSRLKNHVIGDVRDFPSLSTALGSAAPDYAIHLAAQPLVLRSYEDPLETYTTNVDGTRNFLQAISNLPKQPVSLVVTTDKVYRDDGKGYYSERDALGGHDPYSTSKAMADLLTQSWAHTNPSLTIRVARAGNVIGAFDSSENRLIPDAIRSVRSGGVLSLRNPDAIRPWQHVLDCLWGYLSFLEGAARDKTTPTVLNFGPDPDSMLDVHTLVDRIQSVIPTLQYTVDQRAGAAKETQLLTLKSDLAKSALGWSNKFDVDLAVELSLDELSDMHPEEIALGHIRRFLSM